MDEQLSQAEQFLVAGIRRGDSEAWSQLVDRYRGRLLAFARSRLRSAADAEDVLQDVFMTFLKSVGQFRGEAGIETYLFTILRRRMVDFFRGKKRHVCLLHDIVRPDDDGDSGALSSVPSPEPGASWYVRRDEREEIRWESLAAAIRELINGYKKSLNFRDLKIVEMIFYCQIPNKEVGRVVGIDEKQVALIKHRVLNKVRETVGSELRRRGMSPDASDAEADDTRREAMLTRIWETLRLSCPKRSTIGAYHLGTLEKDWQGYVGFHLETLGCEFCRANLDDIKAADDARASDKLRARILESTVGFLRQSYRQ